MYRTPEGQHYIKPETGVIYGTLTRKDVQELIRDLAYLIDEDDKALTWRVRLSPDYLSDAYTLTVDFGRSAFGTRLSVEDAAFTGADRSDDE